jgi:hypothetical protein
MAASTGIVLAATGIAAGNDWYQSNQIPWKIGVAGLALSLFMSGAEKISEPLAVGLSSIMLVTVLITPIGGKNSPLQTVANLYGGK